MGALVSIGCSSFQPFQAVARRHRQIPDLGSGPDEVELALGCDPHRRTEPARRLGCDPDVDVARGLVAVAKDHAPMLRLGSLNIKRSWRRLRHQGAGARKSLLWRIPLPRPLGDWCFLVVRDRRF
jgi:hypothetical protein